MGYPDVKMWNQGQQKMTWFRYRKGLGYRFISDIEANSTRDAKLQATLDQVKKLFYEEGHHLLNGETWCTKFGAKIRYLKGGWWHLYGYAQSGQDVQDCLKILQK